MSTTLAPITGDQVRQFDEDGFTVVRGLFNPGEMAEARAEADRLTRRTDLMDTKNIRCRWMPNVVTGESCQFECFDPVIDISPVCARLAYDERLLDVLAELYREPACLFGQADLQAPGSGYGLHQDWIGWPGSRGAFSVLILFDRAGRDNGDRGSPVPPQREPDPEDASTTNCRPTCNGPAAP